MLVIKTWKMLTHVYQADIILYFLGWKHYASVCLWPQGSSQHVLPADRKEASAPLGHMTSQLIISTSAWPATVYKSAHDLQEQNEESCMIYSGITKLYEYVFTVTHLFMWSCLLVYVLWVCLSNCVRSKNRPADRLSCNLLTVELTSR